MGFLGFNMIYALRISLSIAMVSMVTSHGNSNSEDSDSHVHSKPCVQTITTANDSTNFSPKVSK